MIGSHPTELGRLLRPLESRIGESGVSALVNVFETVRQCKELNKIINCRLPHKKCSPRISREICIKKG